MTSSRTCVGASVAVEQADHRVQRGLVERVAAGGERGELVDHARAAVHRAILAVQREQVPAQVDAQPEPLLERAEHRVVAARERGREVVGELELPSHAFASAARTCSDTRRPSARPATSAIAIGITRPRSLTVSAPDCATARATIAASSSSSSSAGR